MQFLKLPNEVYDILKWVCIIFLPALATAYPALAGIWNWPCAEQISASVSVINMFLGAVLGVSSAEYNRTKLEDIAAKETVDNAEVKTASDALL